MDSEDLKLEDRVLGRSGDRMNRHGYVGKVIGTGRKSKFLINWTDGKNSVVIRGHVWKEQDNGDNLPDNSTANNNQEELVDKNDYGESSKDDESMDVDDDCNNGANNVNIASILAPADLLIDDNANYIPGGNDDDMGNEEVDNQELYNGNINMIDFNENDVVFNIEPGVEVNNNAVAPGVEVNHVAVAPGVEAIDNNTAKVKFGQNGTKTWDVTDNVAFDPAKNLINNSVPTRLHWKKVYGAMDAPLGIKPYVNYFKLFYPMDEITHHLIHTNATNNNADAFTRYDYLNIWESDWQWPSSLFMDPFKIIGEKKKLLDQSQDHPITERDLDSVKIDSKSSRSISSWMKLLLVPLKM